jgi:hypothetical protein
MTTEEAVQAAFADDHERMAEMRRLVLRMANDLGRAATLAKSFANQDAMKETTDAIQEATPQVQRMWYDLGGEDYRCSF